MEPDTFRLRELPPLRPTGTFTFPETRTVITDTTITVGVSRFEVDNRPDEQQVRVWWKRGEQTFRDAYAMPPFGQMLRWTPQRQQLEGRPQPTAPDTVRDTIEVRAEVVGSPEEEKVRAEVKDYEPPWWRRTWATIRLMIAFLGGGIFGYVAARLLPSV